MKRCESVAILACIFLLLKKVQVNLKLPSKQLKEEFRNTLNFTILNLIKVMETVLSCEASS
jgi:hypothetical protein